MQCRGLCGAGGVPPLSLDLGAAAGQSQCRSAGKNHRAIKAQACHLWQLHLGCLQVKWERGSMMENLF